MMHKIVPILLFILTLALPVSVKAQYYSVNYDQKTVAEMAASFNAEAATEMYYAEQLSKIHESYQAAEVAAAGIFTSKFLDRKALTDLGLWTSSTENYYYRRIYHMVSAKIMPKIWTVAGMMLKSPQNALYWGSYLYKVCDETKILCYQFESIVTNSSLSFRDIAFLEINQELTAILKLSELGNVNWKAMLENLGNIGDHFTKESLQQDLDNLYAMGVSIASAGVSNFVNAILANSNFNGTIMDKTASVIEIADNVYSLYHDITTNTGGTLLNMIGGQEAMATCSIFPTTMQLHGLLTMPVKGWDSTTLNAGISTELTKVAFRFATIPLPPITIASSMAIIGIVSIPGMPTTGPIVAKERLHCKTLRTMQDRAVAAYSN